MSSSDGGSLGVSADASTRGGRSKGSKRARQRGSGGSGGSGGEEGTSRDVVSRAGLKKHDRADSLRVDETGGKVGLPRLGSGLKVRRRNACLWGVLLLLLLLGGVRPFARVLAVVIRLRHPLRTAVSVFASPWQQL